MATFGYGRVSTKEQTTENQRREIQTAGYQVEYWFADEGVSGKVSALQRPQFAKMLTQIRDGETLVVTKLDRLGRDAQMSAPRSRCWPRVTSRSLSGNWENSTSPAPLAS